MHKLDLEKAKEPETKLPASAGSQQKQESSTEIKLPASAGSQEKQESSMKTSTSASLTALKPLTVWITTN